MKQKLFVDMDGTLNEWSTTATMHEVCQPGYFTQRLAQRNKKKIIIEKLLFGSFFIC